jgi:hypothetical protein
LVETLKLITGITEDAEFECKFDRNQEDICSGNGICEAGLEHVSITLLSRIIVDVLV